MPSLAPLKKSQKTHICFQNKSGEKEIVIPIDMVYELSKNTYLLTTLKTFTRHSFEQKTTLYCI